MTATEHTTAPVESGTAHLWTVSDSRGAVTLSALHFRGAGLTDLLAVAPSAASVTLATESGFWVFDVLQSHTFGSVGWAPCETHGTCDVDAFGASYAERVWAHIGTTGVTDASVFDELRRVHAEEFGQVAA